MSDKENDKTVTRVFFSVDERKVGLGGKLGACRRKS